MPPARDDGGIMQYALPAVKSIQIIPSACFLLERDLARARQRLARARIPDAGADIRR
jgi:hypothetical protein